MLRLALGVVFAFVGSAWSQTVTEVQVQPGNGGQTQGNPGGAAGPSGGQVSPAATLRAPALKTILPGGSQTPKVQAKGSAGAVVGAPIARDGAMAAPMAPEAEFSRPEAQQREAPPAVDLKKAFEQSEAQNGKTERPTASGTLGSAVRQVQTSRIQEASGSGGFAVNETLRQVFDTARKGSAVAGTNAPKVLVAGRFQDVEEKISQTVRVANGASPHDAPTLYQAAIEAANGAFVPGFARDVARAVLASADKKAEVALPQLANEAYGAAYAGEASAVAKAFKSLGSWDKLLGRPGQALVENIGHLRSDVERVLAQKTAGKVLEANSAQGAPKVWFARAAGGPSFVAMLPASSVSPLPKELAASFALRETESRSANQDDIILAFQRDPTASNGARLIFQANRESGATSFGSAFEAVVYWLKASYAGLWRGAEKTPVAPRSDTDYEAAMALVYARASDWDLASARAFIARGKAMAVQYRKASGDDSALAALSSLEKRFDAGASKFGIEEHDPLPAPLFRLLSGDGATVSHWIERMHDAAPAGQSQILADPADKTFVAARGPASAEIERLLADVKRRTKDAAKTAALVQSLDPSPLRYATIGRVGDYLIQSAGRRTKSGKLMNLTVMRETSGQLAFARAAWAGAPSRPLSPQEIAAP